MRTLDDLEANRAIVAGPTPLPATATMSTPFTPYPRPVTPSDIWQQAFQPMTVAAHQQFGLQQTQQWNASSPLSMMSPMARGMMNTANLAPMRQPFGTPPPALMTTPGVTGMFQTPGDIASQQGLMSSAAFLDPRTAAANLSSQRAEAWGQKYGGPIGAIAGTVGGGMLSGAGGALGGMAGGWVGEQLGNLPLVKQIREFMNADIANNLSWMAQAQHGTFGRVSLGTRDIGLGGRGMSATSAMDLGQKLKGMSQQSGGMFNQMDMNNLTQSAGNAGLLDAATNIDQIADTVGSLMKVIGRLGKLTGDPDFRNNIQELGNLKRMGFTVDQAVDAISDVNRFARGAGLTRGQMSVGMEAGAARSRGAGLTGGVGAMSYAVGAQQGRMLAGAFDPVQADLLGGTAGISQTIEEGRIAFAARTSRLFVPSLLTVGPKGEISLDQDKMRQLGSVGSINMQAIAAHGQQNLHAVAQQVAAQTGEPIASVLGDLMGRMPEFQSKMATQMTPGQYGRIQDSMIMGMRDTFGEYNAARIVMGSDAGARIKLAELSSPEYHQKQVAQLQTAIENQRGETRLLTMGRRQRAQERTKRRQAKSLMVDMYGDPDPFREDAGDVIDAQTEAQRIDDEEYTTRTGLKRMPSQRTGIGTSQKIIEEMKSHAKKQGLDLSRGEGLGAFAQDRIRQQGILGGEGTELTENEVIAYQRATGRYDTWAGALTRNVLGPLGIAPHSGKSTASVVRKFLVRVGEMKKPIQEAMGRSREQLTDMEINFMNEFDKKGIEGAAVLTVLKSGVLTEIARMGKDGVKTLTKPKLRSIMKKAFGDRVPENVIEEFLNHENFATQLGLSFVVHDGSEAAKDVLTEGLDVVDLFEKYKVSGGSVEELEKTMRSKALTTLEEYGIVDAAGEWDAGRGEFIRKFDDVEEEYAHGLMTGARKEGVQSVGRKGALTRTLLALVAAADQDIGDAKERLAKFQQRASPEGRAALKEARAIYKSPGTGTAEEKEKRRKQLGRWWAGEEGEGGIRKMVAEKLGKDVSEVTIEDVTTTFEEAQKGGGGVLGESTFQKERYTGFVEAQGSTTADAGRHAAPAAGSPEEKKAKQLEAELKSTEERYKAWNKLSDASDKLGEAADRIIYTLSPPRQGLIKKGND